MAGTLILSLDFELLWGLSGWDAGRIAAYRPRIEGARKALECILDTLARYDMKCTVAFVGGMAARSRSDFERKAPALRPRYADPLLSSYESLLPGVPDRYPSELLFCRDAILRLAGNPRVELATHTFSHYYGLEPGQTAAEFESDIRSAVEDARREGIDLKTIVFPRNQVSESGLEACSACGLTHYRGMPGGYLYRAERTPARFSLRRILRLADAYVNLSGSNAYPAPERGALTDVPGSRFLRPYDSKLAFLEPLKVRRIVRSIEYAARRGLVYHLWWHPHNFGTSLDRNIGQLDTICRCYARMRDRYAMQNRFIGEL